MKYPYGNPVTLEGYKEYWLKVIKEYRDDGDKAKVISFFSEFTEGLLLVNSLLFDVASYECVTRDGCEQLSLIEGELDKLRQLFKELTEACNVDN